MFDPEVGFTVAIYIGAASGLAVLIILIILDPELDIFALSLKALCALAVSVSVFCMMFTVLNPLLQLNKLSIAAIRNDLANGTVTLRVVSIILGLKILWLVGHLIVDAGHSVVLFAPSLPNFLMRSFRRNKPEFSEVEQISEAVNCEDRDLIIAGQYGLFLIVLALLWTYSALGITTTLTLYLNLTLFFFVDDWVLISEYFTTFRGRVLRSHKRRINIANIMIVPSALVSTFLYFNNIIAAAYSVAIFLVLFWRYVPGPLSTTDTAPNRHNPHDTK